MLISSMTRAESLDLLMRCSSGHLACALQHQPYITPIHFALENGYIYSFSALGQKIAWMRNNPLVCIEVEEIKGREEWNTVIATGTYEELTDSAETRSLRLHAYELLSRRAMWWEPAYVRTELGAEQSSEIVYYRIRIGDISGRRAAADRKLDSSSGPRRGWLSRLIRD